MRSFRLNEAASFLQIHAEELRRRTKAGLIPGAKIGRAWVYLEDDLVAFVRSRYCSSRQALQVTSTEEKLCHYAKEAASIGSTSLTPTGNEYADLLGLPTGASRKNSTIN